MTLINYNSFKNNWDKKQNFILTENILSKDNDIISIYRKLKKTSKEIIILESKEKDPAKSRYSAIAIDPDIIWKCKNNKITLIENKKKSKFRNLKGQEIKENLENLIKKSVINTEAELPPMASGVFGFMSYDMIKYFEPVKSHKKDPLKIEESKFIRPNIILIYDNINKTILISCPFFYNEQTNPEILFKKRYKLVTKINKLIQKQQTNPIITHSKIKNYNFKNNFSADKFQKQVNKAKNFIINGDIFQIIISRRFHTKFKESAFSLYQALRDINPSPFLFYMKFKKYEIIGSSPEIMVKLEDNIITIRPLAGTRKRGKDAKEDKKLAKELLNDKKELAEHLMLIDLGRNDVGRVSEINSVKLTKNMEIEYYSHVMHISSTIEGKSKKNISYLDALIAGFPAGTVSGAPKIKAMELIENFEEDQRSFYSGTIGYFSLHQKYMDMAIMIRTALIKNKILYIQAGAGIVHDSIPKAELEETENKARGLFKAANLAINYPD